MLMVRNRVSDQIEGDARSSGETYPATTLTLSPTQELGQEYRIGNSLYRAFAAIFDSILGVPVFIVLVPVTASLFNIRMTSGGKIDLTNQASVVQMILYVGAWVSYYIASEWGFGSTLGKEVFGLQVRDAGGGRCRFKQILLRNLFRPIDAIGFYLVGFLAAMSTPQRQRIGDLYGRTVVTTKTVPRRFTAFALWVFANLVLIGLVYSFWHFFPSA
jgi:uncharacterized RDD family membrane protein YckC